MRPARLSRIRAVFTFFFLFSIALGAATSAQAGGDFSLSLDVIGRYDSTIYDEGGAEIVAHDSVHQHLYVVNANDASVDVLDIADPSAPTKIAAIDASALGGGVNSVAVQPKRGWVALAIEAEDAQAPGLVAIYSTGTFELLRTFTVGALPDMVTFTPGGFALLVANEGEPDDDYQIDPEGSVSIIYTVFGLKWAWVRTATFEKFIGQEDALRAKGVRIFGPGANAAQDLEPEFITTDRFGLKAFVACQENNALAIVDIWRAKVRRLVPLGTKDHTLAENALDASNRDDAINVTTWPVKGLYLPDAIASFNVNGRDYIVSANEGDSRDYDGFSEEERVGDVDLDPVAFPDAEILQADENLGRLKITTTLGQNESGEYEELYSYGGRSISIWDARGRQVWDSGTQIADITATLLPDQFNSTNDDNDSFDNRSDDKGAEPEGVTTGKVAGRTIAFVGFERVGGIGAWDVSNPHAPKLLTYVNPRNFSVDVCTERDEEGDCETGPGFANPEALDLGPEGLAFIPAHRSPNGEPLLAVGNEVSGTTTIFEISVE